MKRHRTSNRISRDKIVQAAALSGLLLIAGLAFAGPSGVLAWGENVRLLDQRNSQIAKLEFETAELRNRTDLLHPDHADPDLVGELVRSNLGFVHPDEVVIELD
ncbi:septum formation initiator [Altererythrobacter aquiaggeris]|uniref:FtsB family cell division protein n=1 Tax=Aestuarierythrobacter aquiaggeris TaxID=1898396 RepID=UPI003017CF5F